MSNQKIDLVVKLQEIQELAKSLDEKRAAAVDSLCATILTVFADYEKKSDWTLLYTQSSTGYFF